MNKFGLFDVINKLSSSNNANKNLQKIISTLFTTQSNKDNNNNTPTNKNTNKPTYKSQAIIKIMKEHDKISKQIDERQKKTPKK